MRASLLMMVCFFGLLTFILIGAKCEFPPPDPKQVPVYEIVGAEAQAPGVKVIEVAHFQDDQAYHGWRKVFVIEFEGHRYFGVTGIGISEVGTHTTSHFDPASKTTQSRTETDER